MRGHVVVRQTTGRQRNEVCIPQKILRHKVLSPSEPLHRWGSVGCFRNVHPLDDILRGFPPRRLTEFHQRVADIRKLCVSVETCSLPGLRATASIRFSPTRMCSNPLKGRIRSSFLPPYETTPVPRSGLGVGPDRCVSLLSLPLSDGTGIAQY